MHDPKDAQFEYTFQHENSEPEQIITAIAEEDATDPGKAHAEWLTGGMGGADEDQKEAYKYFMRPDPNQRKLMGPVIEEYDEFTGRKMKYREARIGMVRGAAEENLRPMRVYLEPLPHIRLNVGKPLQGWYQSKFSETGRNRPRPCMTDAILTQPYSGYCTVGCAFCYVNSGQRGYRGSGLVTVPMNYGSQVKNTIKGLKTITAGYFSSFIEPFLPLENYYHNTQRGAQAFVDEGLPIFFLSRLKYPQWAIELLQHNKYSYAQKSINTSDPAIWRKLSPGALGLEEHLEDIRRLHKEGIYVSIQCNPIVPGVVTHDDIIKLFEKLADAGTDHVIVKFVEASFNWAPAMVERITGRFGQERGDAFRKLFTQNIGGQRTIAEDYRMEGHRLYMAAASRVGMTYSTCYEYKYARDENGKIKNKIGVSIGSDFITADQCHGHRVPMFTRDNLSDRFREVEECPPQGCLTCGDGQPGGIGACGSEIYSSAPALTLAHLKVGIYDKVSLAKFNKQPEPLIQIQGVK